MDSEARSHTVGATKMCRWHIFRASDSTSESTMAKSERALACKCGLLPPKRVVFCLSGAFQTWIQKLCYLQITFLYDIITAETEKGDFMIKNYIFDFGNVLVKFDTDELTAVCVSDKETRALIRDVVFDREYWDKLDAGAITDDEVKAAIRSRLPKELGDTACEVFDRWIYLDTPINGMPDVVKDIKKSGGKLYLLSNISVGFAENYHKNPFVKELFSHFDGLVFSGPLGITKPHKEIFEYLLDKYALSADECIFIDDRADNIEGAEKAGIKGCHFDGNAENLRKKLDI